MKKQLFQVVFILTVLFGGPVFADVRLPHLISDGVILQRDTENLLWGWADKGESVEVRLDGKVIGKAVVKDKKWSIVSGPVNAGGPYTLEVTGKNTVTINNVYFGDVWIASGQSNMQTSMGRVSDKYPDEIAQAYNSQIRIFTVPGNYDFDGPHDNVAGGRWQQVSPQTIKSFSAVAYFFAKKIHVDKHVPVGIINSSYGGSPVEGWMSEEALEAYPHYLNIAKKYRNKDYLQSLKDLDQKRSAGWYGNLLKNDLGMQESPTWFAREYSSSKWASMHLPAYWEDEGVAHMNGIVWFKKDIDLPEGVSGKAARLMLGRIVDADTVYINGIEVGNTTYQYPPRRYSIAKDILKAGKNTITVRVVSNSGKGGFIKDKPYYLAIGDEKVDLKGAWRYKIGVISEPVKPPAFNQYGQPLGFYNAMLAPLLNVSMKGAIWYQGESNTNRPVEYMHLFPAMIRDWRKQWGKGDFPFVFVQLANFLEAHDEPTESTWAETRNAQLKALSEPNTAMAVAIDVGEWNDIHPLNKKSVGERLAIAARHLAYADNVVHSGPIFTSLSVKEKRLELSFKHVGSGLVSHNGSLKGFAIAGEGGKFVWANAKIKDNKIIVWNNNIKQPIKVRYGWADNPENANLYNKDGLPASPFEAAIH